MATLDHQNDQGNRRIRSQQSLAAVVTAAMFTSSTSGEDSVAIFAVPKNSIITRCVAVNTTAWSGTTPELIVGTSSDDDGFVTASNFTPTVGSKNGSGALINATTGANDLLILAEATWGASKPTAGETVVIVSYIEFGVNAGAPNMGQVAEVRA